MLVDSTQLAFPTDIKINNNLVPIYIGTAKKVFSKIPFFLDIECSQIRLDEDDNYELDETSIFPIMTYYSNITEETSVAIGSNTLIINNISIPYEIKLNKNIILIGYNDINDVLFSSTISKITYSLDRIIKIELDDIILSGIYKIRIIERKTENIKFTYNPLTKIVQLDWENKKFFNSIISGIITYTCFFKNYFIQTINKNDILNFDGPLNIVVANHIHNSSQKAIVISIPNESYLDMALEEIEINQYGYMIIPIELSSISYNKIENFVKNKQYENMYFITIIPTDINQSVIQTFYYSYSYPAWIEDEWSGNHKWVE